MNRTELVAAMAEKASVSKKDADNILKAFIDTVEEAVKADDKVQLVGFGTFESRERAAREGKNPRTGEKITIAASKVPVFKAGKAFKDLLKSVTLKGCSAYTVIYINFVRRHLVVFCILFKNCFLICYTVAFALTPIILR